ncbi:glycoside hydrolase family 57 protein [Haliovirga abyssi]|uniref:Glycoside hydrolase n=1 Tax=Haliovirga abyssi TaxID=2996794 RepID=A0AAU9DSC9_9FUSO|nr:1,4-alpha-glucan branching protein domain-containing protein [Haliovirga abyssi]BDU49914.1 glycoside hydrolase [Haliovirga abyssi]
MNKGYLAMVLHAHLPYVRHPEYNDFLEEDWLYEAITETYIPLLDMFEKLTNDNIPWKITLTMSGTLLNMLADELLQNRYLRHLDKIIELTEKEVTRVQFQPEFLKTALHNEEYYKKARYYFKEKYNRNIIQGFKKFQDIGNLEIIPVTATHGFLPLMKDYPEAVNAQVEMAKIDYKRFFDKDPKGMWLAECAYYPGQDKYLEKHGIRYFFVDSHGILFGDPKPAYGVYSPVYTKNGVAAFGRDIESSEQVWSSEIGYPGDGNYREFHKDAGYELEYEYIKPYLHEDGVRRNIGIKYYAITDKTGKEKQPYDPEKAANRAKEHAYNFVENRGKQIEYLSQFMEDRKPIIVSPYDAELYGHWWYEGPIFLEWIFRAMAEQSISAPITPYGYLKEYPKNQVVTPAESSWGANGYYDVWVDESNHHIYRHIHKGIERMIELANTYENPEGILLRALNQAARELMMSQTSCWPFIMFTGTMVGYAEKKIRDHINRLYKIYFDIRNGKVDENWLAEIEYRDNIFPEIDYKVYRTDRLN